MPIAPPVDPPANPPVAGDVEDCGTADETQVVALANADRIGAGVGALACDAQMVAAARTHSRDMCNGLGLDHTGSDGSSAGDRLRRHGVQFRTWAENIASGYRNAEAVHRGWMNSAGHRRNLMNGRLGRVGVGRIDCGNRTYWTQVFAN